MIRTRVLLADDHPMVLEGLSAFLTPHVDCIWTASNGRELVEAALRLQPDLIIADITMPLLNGIDAVKQIKKSLPNVKVLFTTMHLSPAYLEAALHAGGTGYVLKSAAREELLEAIGTVMGGEIYVTPGLAKELLGGTRDPARAAEALRLSEREREVLQLIAEGNAAKVVAHILQVSTKTVEFHRANIKRKLGLGTTAALTKYAIEQGLIH
jgi:DNA-binding NarL/FixJ family response regulator